MAGGVLVLWVVQLAGRGGGRGWSRGAERAASRLFLTVLEAHGPVGRSRGPAQCMPGPQEGERAGGVVPLCSLCGLASLVIATGL